MIYFCKNICKTNPLSEIIRFKHKLMILNYNQNVTLSGINQIETVVAIFGKAIGVKF